VTVVAADDYVLTGTLGTNSRLADPTLTDSDVDDRLAELWLDRSGLTATTSFGSGGRALSGGEQRRVCLGTRPVHPPPRAHRRRADQRPGRGDRPAHTPHPGRLPDTTVVLALHALPEGLEPGGQMASLSLASAAYLTWLMACGVAAWWPWR
jgi:ATP-binding cassette, subfamily C, bacterial CydC